MTRGLVWESVSWRCGADQYRFDIERGGLYATLTAPGRTLTLPMAVWDGLFDTLKARRATNSRSEQQFPPRSRARWYDGEVAEAAESFRSGRSIGDIAHAHNRSAYAIEHQLDRLGLISKSGIYGPGPPGSSLSGSSLSGAGLSGPSSSRPTSSGTSPETSNRTSPSARPFSGGSAAGAKSAPPPQDDSMVQSCEAPPSSLSGDRWEIRDDT